MDDLCAKKMDIAVYEITYAYIKRTDIATTHISHTSYEYFVVNAPELTDAWYTKQV